MGWSFPFFFLMKKNDTVYGLFDGRIVPHAVCSFRNWESSLCLACKSWIVLLMRVGGASGFKSMAWSHGWDGGSPPPLRCSKTSQ